ncbi:unnamed protein product [Durusdinium trenchii]|uniref:Uncharacterized protein n=2 Tax=Durusdinium trenchii TaxID=1381693 RepID=A0ABP0QN81_9DINO
MECAESRVFGIGPGLLAVLLIFSLSLLGFVVASCLARSCRQSIFCLVVLANLGLTVLLVALPKGCQQVVQAIGINRQGQFSDIAVAVVVIGALGASGLVANEFLLRSTVAVPRDERLAGWRSAAL